MPAPLRTSLSRILLAALWAAAILRVFWPHPAIDRAGAAGLAAYAALALLGALQWQRMIDGLSAATRSSGCSWRSAPPPPSCGPTLGGGSAG
ncbi:MAG: hypothetical protein GEU92_19350, partial [Alphaproteobacteria bacterium]|nr:hypothetical protein [Alphaproteobacteria bacterium]